MLLSSALATCLGASQFMCPLCIRQPHCLCPGVSKWAAGLPEPWGSHPKYCLQGAAGGIGAGPASGTPFSKQAPTLQWCQHPETLLSKLPVPEVSLSAPLSPLFIPLSPAPAAEDAPPLPQPSLPCSEELGVSFPALPESGTAS